MYHDIDVTQVVLEPLIFLLLGSRGVHYFAQLWYSGYKHNEATRVPGLDPAPLYHQNNFFWKIIKLRPSSSLQFGTLMSISLDMVLINFACFKLCNNLTVLG